MIGRMCKVGDGLSRPVLIARETFSYRKISRKKSFYFILFSVLSSNICRGYSGEEPPLPIPNREVKLTIADGTDLPVGRVGSRRFWKPDRQMTTGLLCFRSAQTQKRRRCRCLTPALRAAPRGDRGKTPGSPSAHTDGLVGYQYYQTYRHKKDRSPRGPALRVCGARLD